MTFNDLINANVDFKGIGDWFTELYNNATAQGTVKVIWDMLDGYLKMIPIVTAVVLLALSLVQVFAGKKLLGLQKFVGSFVVGFVCGAYFITPLVANLIAIPDWIVGLVVGVVAALICKLVYFLAYVLAAGYPVYLICMAGTILPAVTAMTKGNMIFSGVAAAVAIVLALILRKWIEMLGTAALGGYCAFLSIDAILVALLNGGIADIAVIAPYANIVKIVVIAIFALVGFIVQVKTRKRY